MKDILQQIQNLKEDFMNLIEVEGLGQPASDVPPSTNKIKKDRKTKNGKVELVSVEDELFPYDGNKREQYRQKILDTINGMIQGTATLEDLLQIVRQKKAPLKEAMEVLEELIAEKKTHVFLKQDLDDAKIRKLKKENPGILYVEDEYLDLDGSQADLKKRILATHKEGNSGKLEEALKLLEGLFVNDGRKDLLWNDIAGRSDTPISAASNVLKNKLNKAYKGTQKKMPVKEGLDKFEVAMGILEEMINEVSDKYIEGKIKPCENSKEEK